MSTTTTPPLQPIDISCKENANPTAAPPTTTAKGAATTTTKTATPTSQAETSVRVAVRVRPLLPKESTVRARECIDYVPNDDDTRQIVLGGQRSFTYDYVYAPSSNQEELYETAVTPLIGAFFDGYNATVLAYGQTGSGKTYTMGSGSNAALDESTLGVIPRVIKAMYARIDAAKEASPDVSYAMRVSFLEIHNENIVDLFNPIASSKTNSLAIREADGSITVAGITELHVTTAHDLLEKLERGSISRTTASTLMNSESSRSHAIFSLVLEQTREDATLVSKFHFVDLAGSERLKRTKAVGDRLKEGININCGLLALGNVISALGDPKRSSGHIPYRDSKLTRLLQDSLGGNSRTLMIACVSPADINFEETLNTLRYADRARKIKNKPIVNLDLNNVQVSSLKAHIKALQAEVSLLRGGSSSGPTSGSSSSSSSSSSSNASTAQVMKLEMENEVLQSAYDKLQAKVKALHESLATVTLERDEYRSQLETAGLTPAGQDANADTPSVVAQYAATIDDLKAQLAQALSSNNGSGSGSGSAARDLDRASTSADSFEMDDDDESATRTTSGNTSAELEQLEEAAAGAESEFEAAQTQVASQITDLDRNISLKEELLAKVVESKMKLNVMKEEYESRLAALHSDIASIEADKAAIETELAAMKTGSKTGSVQVRKTYEAKLRKLNKQLKSLKDHKVELERLQRVRAKEAQRMESLQASIADMKRARISLVRKARDDAKAHAAWKADQARKVSQLMAQKRKNEAKLKKQERALVQQQAVTRRKLEELSHVKAQLRSNEASARAAAASKRAAMRASTANGDRAKPAWGQNNIRGMPKVIRAKLSGIKKYFAGVFTEHVAHARALTDLESKLASRERLVRELQALDETKKELEDELTAAGEEDVGDKSSDDLYSESQVTGIKAELAAVLEDMESLEAKLEFEASSLAEAQEELAGSKFRPASELEEFFDSQLDERLVRRIERLSGHECRAALEYSISQVIATRVANEQLRNDLVVASASIEDKERMLTVANASASAREAELTKVQSEYEDKVLFLLEKVKDDAWASLPERSEDPEEHEECVAREDKLKALLELKSEHLGILQAHNTDLKAAVARHKQNVEDLLATSSFRRKVLQQVKTENLKLQARVESLESEMAATGVAVPPGNRYVSPMKRPSSSRRVGEGAGHGDDEEGDDSMTSMASVSTADSSSVSTSSETTSVSPSPPPEDRTGGYAAAHQRRRRKNKGSETSGSSGSSGTSESSGTSGSSGKTSKRRRVKHEPDEFTREACCGVFSGHSGAVYSVAASKGYDLVYSGSADKLVKMWDAESGKCIESLHGHVGSVDAVIAAAGHVFSGGRDKSVRVWDPSQQYPCTASISTGSEVTSLVLNDYTLYAGLSNGAIKRFDVRNMSSIRSLPSLRGLQSSVFSLALSPVDQYLVAGYRSHHVGLFDLAEADEEGGCEFVTLQPPHYDGVTALTIHDGMLYSGSKASNIKAWKGVPSFRDGEANSGISSRIITSHAAGVTGMMVADDVLHSTDREGGVQFWDLQAEQGAGELVGAHADAVTSILGFGTDYFVTSGTDRLVKLWRVSFS